jgi:dimethylhistidine N-methyltransferase
MTIAPALHRLHDLEPTLEEFRDSVLDGLAGTPKTLPCKFFYDEEGSRLFDRICELPEYYPTRTECALLATRAEEIAALAGPGVELVEFGSGAGLKVRLLLDALRDPAVYVPVDIARDHLMAAAGSLAHDFPGLRVAPICADYTNAFALPALPGIRPERTLGFFPGSTIGNFTPAEATDFLRRAARLLGHGSMMIVGVDLPKDPAILHAAYDDKAGVTAAFNRNLLHRINRELGADFDVDAFGHEARWNAPASRVEMHLVSRTRQTVRVASRSFDFQPAESIHTESSHKYGIEVFAGLAGRAGYARLATWTDPAALFSIHILQATGR